jgi:hypothetical protein
MNLSQFEGKYIFITLLYKKNNVGGNGPESMSMWSSPSESLSSVWCREEDSFSSVLLSPPANTALIILVPTYTTRFSSLHFYANMYGIANMEEDGVVTSSVADPDP